MGDAAIPKSKHLVPKAINNCGSVYAASITTCDSEREVSTMASISNVSLEVGSVGGGVEFARVTGRLNFSAGERDMNVSFLVYADLYERDDALDVFIPQNSNQFATQVARGNRDDLIGEIGRQNVRPNGNSSVDLEFRREWDFGNQESGNEEYRALITAYPDIRGATRFSNEVSINLG